MLQCFPGWGDKKTDGWTGCFTCQVCWVHISRWTIYSILSRDGRILILFHIQDLNLQSEIRLDFCVLWSENRQIQALKKYIFYAMCPSVSLHVFSIFELGTVWISLTIYNGVCVGCSIQVKLMYFGHHEMLNLAEKASAKFSHASYSVYCLLWCMHVCVCVCTLCRNCGVSGWQPT